MGIESELQRFISQIEEYKPDIRYLVNSACVAKMAKYTDFTREELSRTIEINAKAVVLLCQACLPFMSKGSKILNISSAASFQPNPYINIYSATKVFVKNYSRALNYELKQTGITCTAVCPGWVDTDMLQKEGNGKKIAFPGLVPAEKVVTLALKDANRGKDISVCSLFVKYEHLCSKILPEKIIMKNMGKSRREISMRENHEDFDRYDKSIQSKAL